MPTIEGRTSLTTASVVRIHVVQYTRVTTGICINSALKCCAIAARADLYIDPTSMMISPETLSGRSCAVCGAANKMSDDVSFGY